MPHIHDPQIVALAEALCRLIGTKRMAEVTRAFQTALAEAPRRKRLAYTNRRCDGVRRLASGLPRSRRSRRGRR